MTLEEQLGELAAQGIRVNNLFQLDDGRWRADLRREEFSDFGHGDSPQAALRAALVTGLRSSSAVAVRAPVVGGATMATAVVDEEELGI